MSTIAAIETQADLLIKGSAPPNDHFLHPKAPPTMPWEMKYDERRHCSHDPRIQKQLKDEMQFEDTIVKHVWSDVISKFAPTLEERWMTAVDLERMLLSQGVTNPRLRGKVCDVLDTTGVVFDGSTVSKVNNNNNHHQSFFGASSASFASSSMNNNNKSSSSEKQQFRGILKKGMNVNSIMSTLFAEDPNTTTTTTTIPNTYYSSLTSARSGKDFNDTMTTTTSSSAPAMMLTSMMTVMNDDNATTTTTTTNRAQPKESNLVRLTNLRNEMRWNGIVVCKQIQLLLTDPSRQDDFIEACFDRFDRTDPAKRVISKNALLHTNLKLIDPLDDQQAFQTFRWFDTPQVPESAKQYTKQQSQNPKIQKEMTRYLEAQRKKIEEESTFVLPDLPTTRAKKKKKTRRKKGEVELPSRMMSGATFHQLEPLKAMIMMNEIGNEFYPYITYEDFKAAFLNPKHSQWVASFLGVIFEAMATFCTVTSAYSSTGQLQLQSTNNNSNNSTTNKMILSTNSLASSTTTAQQQTTSRFTLTSTTLTTSRATTTTTATSQFSYFHPQTANISAPLPPLPWLTKTLHTVPSAPLMADADILLLLQLEKAGGSATDPVEKKKKKKNTTNKSSASSSSSSRKQSNNTNKMSSSFSTSQKQDQQQTPLLNSSSKAKKVSEDIFGASGIVTTTTTTGVVGGPSTSSTSAANDFLASMMMKSKNEVPSTTTTMNHTPKPPSSSSAPANGVPSLFVSKDDDDEDGDGQAKKRTRVKFL